MDLGGRSQFSQRDILWQSMGNYVTQSLRLWTCMVPRVSAGWRDHAGCRKGLCSFGCKWQTSGNAGTAKPEAVVIAEWTAAHYARSATGYFASEQSCKERKNMNEDL